MWWDDYDCPLPGRSPSSEEEEEEEDICSESPPASTARARSRAAGRNSPKVGENLFTVADNDNVKQFTHQKVEPDITPKVIKPCLIAGEINTNLRPTFYS